MAGRGTAVTEDSTSQCARCASIALTLADARVGVSRLARKGTFLEVCSAGRPSARLEKVWREVATLKDRLREYEDSLGVHRAAEHGSAA